MSIETIGAHFSCIVENRRNLPPGKYAYESARSALYALLKSMEIKRIHVPNYICEAVPEAILKAGGSVIKYPIGSDFKSDGTARKTIFISNWLKGKILLRWSSHAATPGLTRYF